MLTKANLNFPSFGPGDLCDVFLQVSNPICLFLYVLLLDMPSRGAWGKKGVCIFLPPYSGNVSLWQSCQVKKSATLSLVFHILIGSHLEGLNCSFLEMDPKLILARS